jgi:8-hydroxy-5-deazaflavin:NADPH oxidoreductase
MKRFGVIGSGPVGQALAAGLKEHGYDVRIASRSPEKLTVFSTTKGIPTGTFGDVAAWAEGLVLAVQGRAAIEALRIAGASNIKGKLVIDTTNPISDEPPDQGVIRYFTSANSSLGEQLQAAYPDAHIVKAFNSVGNAFMVNPSFRGKPTMFYCGNNEKAKQITEKILEQFGWEPADMGSIVSSRAIEPLCQLWCIPGFREKRWHHAFKLLRG